MFEQDYLMRQIMQLVQAIMRSMQQAGPDEEDPAAAADLLESAVGSATELDGATLLQLAPESISTILEVSSTDPHIAEYVARSLHLAGHYRAECGQTQLAALRQAQAEALASAYGFSLTPELSAEDSMKAFLADEEAKKQAATSGDGANGTEESAEDNPIA